MTVRVALNNREAITEETIVTAVLVNNNREAMAPVNNREAMALVKMTAMAPPVNKELMVPPAPTTATEAPVKLPANTASPARKEAQVNNKDTDPVLKTPTEVPVPNREVMALMIPPMAPALRTLAAILTAALTIPPMVKLAATLAATHTDNLTTRMDLEHRNKIPMVNQVARDRVAENMEMISEVEQLMIRMGADNRVDNRVDSRDMEMIL
jgi:hypothetical protein